MKIRFVLSGLAVLAFAPAASYAKPADETHHCMKDGEEIGGVSEDQCKGRGGKWERHPGGEPAQRTGPGTSPPATPKRHHPPKKAE